MNSVLFRVALKLAESGVVAVCLFSELNELLHLFDVVLIGSDFGLSETASSQTGAAVFIVVDVLPVDVVTVFTAELESVVTTFVVLTTLVSV